MGKKEQKQFPLDSKENCCIYLLRIITTAEKCFIKLKRYNSQAKEILDKYESTVPYDVYSEFVDKTSGVISYLLNIIGDSQEKSISYFKYRKKAKRLMDNQVDNVIIAELSNEIQELLMDFNKMRNWYNHIPESLLITEQDLIKQGKAYEQRHNPIELYLYHDVTYEYFNDLYNKNIEFYKVARELIHAAKIDYSYLIGESITVERKYLDDPIRINQLDIAKKSAKVQGIKGHK